MKNQIERAEPSRGAPDHRETVRSHPEYPRMAEAVNKHFPAGRANSGYAIEAIYDFVTSRESGHVVLLEALRHGMCEHLKVHEDLDFNVCSDCGFRWDHRKSLQRALRDEAEAAIQQAERT